MFNLNKPKKIKRTPQAQVIADKLLTLDPLSDEYQATLKILERHDAMEAPTRPKPISHDTILTGVVNIGLGGAVMLFETRNIWMSKVPLNFMGKNSK